MRRFSLVQFLPRSSLSFSYTILVGSSGRDCESQCIVIRLPITPIAAAGGFGDVRQIRNPSFFFRFVFFSLTAQAPPSRGSIQTQTPTPTAYAHPPTQFRHTWFICKDVQQKLTPTDLLHSFSKEILLRPDSLFRAHSWRLRPRLLPARVISLDFSYTVCIRKKLRQGKAAQHIWFAAMLDNEHWGLQRTDLHQVSCRR